MSNIRYGTSSWSAKGWVGPFYPKGTPPGEFLRHYATQFDTVEADVTYYRVPDSRLVDGWVDKTPGGFQLAAKFPRTVVHGGESARPDPERVLVHEHVGELATHFVAMMSRMGDKLGPLILQFPYFNRSAFTGPDPFLERLDAFLAELPDGPRYAVEVRNKAWVASPLLEILRKHGVALVLADMSYMPHPLDMQFEFAELCTANFSVVRLIGNRKATEAHTKTFDRIVIDNSKRLTRWAETLQGMLPHVDEIFTFANNHFAGHGPSTIRELREMVEEA